MENPRSTDVAQNLDGLLASPDSSLSSDSLQGTTPTAQSVRTADHEPTPAYVAVTQRLRLGARLRTIAIITAVILLLGGVAFWYIQRGSNGVLPMQASNFDTVHVALDSLSLPRSGNETAQTLKINGQLRVSTSLIITPGPQPKSPVIGQLYYDRTSNRIAYYNGQEFVNLGENITNNVTNNITNITNNSTGNSNTQGTVTGTPVELQGSTPGIQQAGNFNIAGTGIVGTLKTSIIDSTGTTLFINPTSPVSSNPGSGGTPGSPATLGLTSGSQISTGTEDDVLIATKATMPDTSGTAKSISVFIVGGSPSNHFQVGLYEDDGDIPSKPATLLAASPLTNIVPDSVNTVTIPSTALSPNTTYWIAYNTDDPAMKRQYNGGSQISCFISSNFGFMPNPFEPLGCFYSSQHYAIYVNYITGGSGGPGGSGGKSQFSLSSTGQALFQNSEDSTTAFQIQNSTGTSTIFSVDSINGRIGIGKASAAYKLDIAGGDINLSNNRSIRFGGLQALSYSSTSLTTLISNFTSGGRVTVAADNFAVQDINGIHDNFLISSIGAATFSNSSNSVNAFRIQNSLSQDLFTVDTLGGNISLQSRGTGDISLTTATASGVSGDVSITTGNSSTTASGNITIDSGSGVVDGTVVGTKTFESGVDNMINWFGSTLAQTSAQQHTGSFSLRMTATGAFWGIQEDINNPITSVTPGHQYHFSIWARADTIPRSITSTANWVGGSGGTSPLQFVTDSTTGWTEVTGNAVAPPGATGVYLTMSGTSAVNEIHYFDDMVITDLNSSSAASTINIGSTNAKVVTIGNINQIGATSIIGGNGINLNSGVSDITLSGGAISVIGSAASSFSTSNGALTLTSAASATWGISTASSGVGGTLTVRGGGGGGSGNTDGGDLILQGGARSGTGNPGSVIVKPPSDVTDAFQIQSSAGTPLFVADSSGMKITVIGIDAAFATLVLTDAHFSSIQTTAPTIGTPTNCGTGPTAIVAAGSTDSAGAFTITTGAGGTSSTCDATVTFHQSYGGTPKSILVVGKTDAGSVARQIFVSGANATTFTISFATSTGGADSTTYSFSYWIIE